MGIVLKGIEIENFKSYQEKRYIHLSDLSVLLGANSSGKSTALQALLALKQTMECNSPDEELLLSGKYVTLGDYDDVISNPDKKTFTFSVILCPTGKSENTLEEDDFKICWNFKQGEDGVSIILNKIEMKYENMELVFCRTQNGHYNLFIDGNQSAFSVDINNLFMTRFYIHYDVELNRKAAELLDELTHLLISQKVTKAAADEPVGVDAIKEFFVRLLEKVSNRSADKKLLSKGKHELAVRVERLLDGFGSLELPKYEAITRTFPKDLRTTILGLAFTDLESTEHLESILVQYENYLAQYKKLTHAVSEYRGIYDLGMAPFRGIGEDEGKKDNWTQLKYALDFYKEFYTDIISKIFFVGPIRENPKGLYNIGFETVPKYVGPMGAYFASVLLHENKKEKEYILPHGKERCTLSEALAAWMVHLNIASSVNVDKKNSFGFSVSVENMEQIRSDIMNVGIGTSQVLPVLISVLLSEPNELLIFEQPELHLHPYSQSRLADMFVEFCRQGRKVILETHSEYFLLRLRYHVVKEHFPKESAAINFFHYAGGTVVESASISGLGNIEYPRDFRDETQELLDEILEAALERKGL